MHALLADSTCDGAIELNVLHRLPAEVVRNRLRLIFDTVLIVRADYSYAPGGCRVADLIIGARAGGFRFPARPAAC